MAFFKRLFSSDYRAAVAAEASGDLELAAERYALAGQNEAAARVHLARAERARSRAGEIDALRDALHWAPAEGDWRRRAARALGEALLARARAEAVATERDRDRVREAATLLIEAGAYREAGEAYESIGDDRGAARAFEHGGLVDRMEEALRRDEERHDRARRERELFADYELARAGGDRDGAVSALRRCVEIGADRSEYRRLLDELESRLLTGGRVALRSRGRDALTLCGAGALTLGRDPLCDWTLRAPGVSRRHARIELAGDAFTLADAGSRNGTLVGGMPIAAAVPLASAGSFELGEHCAIDYEVAGEPPRLSLRVARGLDQGRELRAAPEGVALPLEALGVAATLRFDRGRPILEHPPGGLVLNDEPLARGDVQLIRGDALSIAGVEVEVEG